MEAVNHPTLLSNDLNKETSLEKRIQTEDKPSKKRKNNILVTGIALLMLKTTGFGFLNKPAYPRPDLDYNSKSSITDILDDNAQDYASCTDDDSQNIIKRIKNIFKKDKQDKNSAKIKKQNKQNQHHVKPLNITVLNPDKSICQRYRNMTAKQLQQTVINVPYNGLIYFEEQTSGEFKSDIMLKYDFNQDGKYDRDEIVNNPITGRKVFENRISFDRLDYLEGEKIRWTYQLEKGTKIAASISGYLELKAEPKPAPVPEPKKEPVQKQEKAVTKREVAQPEKTEQEKQKQVFDLILRAAGFLGSESYIVEKDPKNTFKGICFEGLFSGKNYRVRGKWAGMNYDVEEIAPMGEIKTRTYSEGDLELNLNLFGILAGEAEARTSKHGWTPYNSNVFSIAARESSHSGLSFGGGLIIPLTEKGFAGPFILATLGKDFGTQEYAYTDNVWYSLTTESMAIKGDYYKFLFHTDFLEIEYCQEKYNDAEQSLNGKKSNLRIMGFVPVPTSKLIPGLNLKLLGYYSRITSNDSLIEDFIAESYGVGFQISKK